MTHSAQHEVPGTLFIRLMEELKEVAHFRTTSF